MQSNRLFEILYILLNKERVTAGELAERFGVSTRTIYRDIDTLSLANIPIYTEKGKGGGISLLSDYVINKSILNDQEQTEILSALQGLSHLNAIDSDSALQKLSATFKKTATNWLEVDFSDWSYSDTNLFSDLKSAILERQIVAFNYFGASGEATYRRIEPLQLCFKSKYWYLKGYCLNREDMRLFKLTRMRNLVVTHEIFKQRDLLSSHSKAGNLGSTKKEEEMTLKLKIAPEMTYRLLDKFGDGVQQEDGSFIVRVKGPYGDWLYGFILSFGESIEVLEPAYMREIVREKAEKIKKKYL
jgi:predicted DNA-binding transcriptional regulator YafY